MLALLLISCSSLVQAETPEPSELEQQVARLVRQLDDDDWGRRQDAEQKLLEMGTKALPLLPNLSERMSPEAKDRLTRVQSQLQVQHALVSVEASRVTLQGTMSLAEAMEKLEASTGNAITGYDEMGEQSITVDVAEVPFWEAFDQVLDQAKLTVYPYAGDAAALHVVPSDADQAARAGTAYYQGVFRVQPTYVSAARNLLNPSIQGLRVRLSIAWEPRAKPISLSLPLSSISASDDGGTPIEVDGAQGRLSAAIEADVPIVEMEVPLQLPTRAARQIATLKGSFDVMIPGQTESFEFGKLDQEEEQILRRAGVTVTLKQVRKNDDVDEIGVHIEFDEAANALESHRGWIYKNEAYVLDAEGNRMEHGGRRLISQGKNSIHVGFMFVLDQPLADYKFVYKTPTLIIQQPMRFELKNIDLP